MGSICATEKPNKSRFKRTASMNECKTASTNACEIAPINKCEPAPMPAKTPTSTQDLKKENIPERKNFKFSLSKKFTLTFDTQLSFLIYSNLIKFIYVLSDKD
jgi:hypothetical protein